MLLYFRMAYGKYMHALNTSIYISFHKIKCHNYSLKIEA